jgi:hypothetical protein
MARALCRKITPASISLELQLLERIVTFGVASRPLYSKLAERWIAGSGGGEKWQSRTEV